MSWGLFQLGICIDRGLIGALDDTADTCARRLCHLSLKGHTDSTHTMDLAAAAAARPPGRMLRAHMHGLARSSCKQMRPRSQGSHGACNSCGKTDVPELVGTELGSVTLRNLANMSSGVEVTHERDNPCARPVL